MLFTGPGGRWELKENLANAGRDLTDMITRFGDAGLVQAREYVFKMDSKGKRLHVHGASFLSNDNQRFAEFRIGNDMLPTTPEERLMLPGYQKGHLWVAIDGRTLIDTRKLAAQGHFVELFDQGGISFQLGEPLALASTELDNHPYIKDMKAYFDKLPVDARRRLIATAVRWWVTRDVRGEDHWGHTQNVGSAGNSYRNYRLMLYVLWREGHISTTAYRQGLKAAHHFIIEQFGASFDAEFGETVYVPGRGYHLYEYDTENHQALAFDNEAWSDSKLYQGVVQCRRDRNSPWGEGLDCLGRENLRIHDVRSQGWDEDDWVGSRIIGFPCKVPSAITKRGRNPFDIEHHYRHHWHEPFAFSPSRFADLSLEQLFRTSKWTKTWPTSKRPMPGFSHSDRAFGYALKLCAGVMIHFHGLPLRQEARIIADQLVMHLAEDNWKPEWCREWTFYSRSSTYINDRAEWVTTAGWQVAIIKAALHDLKMARPSYDLTEFEAKADRIMEFLWAEGPEGGWHENVKVYKDGRVEKDGKQGYFGTRHWMPNYMNHNPQRLRSWEVYRTHNDFQDEDRKVYEWQIKQAADLDYQQGNT